MITKCFLLFSKNISQILPVIPFQENALTGEQLTASKLRSKSIQLAESLKIVGFKPGDQIATCCENRFEYAYVLMASIYLGVTLTPMNVDYTDGKQNVTLRKH